MTVYRLWRRGLRAILRYTLDIRSQHLPYLRNERLAAMAAAILVAVFDGKLAVPHWPYVLAQGLIGCLVARSIGPAILLVGPALARAVVRWTKS